MEESFLQLWRRVINDVSRYLVSCANASSRDFHRSLAGDIPLTRQSTSSIRDTLIECVIIKTLSLVVFEEVDSSLILGPSKDWQGGLSRICDSIPWPSKIDYSFSSQFHRDEARKIKCFYRYLRHKHQWRRDNNLFFGSWQQKKQYLCGWKMPAKSNKKNASENPSKMKTLDCVESSSSLEESVVSASVTQMGIALSSCPLSST